jgi:hypothetical protein
MTTKGVRIEYRVIVLIQNKNNEYRVQVTTTRGVTLEADENAQRRAQILNSQNKKISFCAHAHDCNLLPLSKDELALKDSYTISLSLYNILHFTERR